MKFIYLLSAVALLSFSCNNQPKEAETKVIERETIREVEVEAEAAPEKEKGTTVKVGPDGGSVETENVAIEIQN